MTRPDAVQFRKRLAAGELLAGTFVKTPTGHATEIFGDLGYDFVVIDEEHAPFDRRSIDDAIVSARAANIAPLVRVASSAPSNLLSVLDCGAVGVLVPHVASVERAKEIAAACRYRKGSRGFSNSPRAGRYGGLNLSQHIEQGDATTTVVAQIEDPSALSVVEEIARVDGVDALFVGRGDLAAAMEENSSEAPAVRAASERIAKAGRAAGKPVWFFVGSLADAAAMRDIGGSCFIYMSDQGLMRQAAAKALVDLKTLK
ncbi:MAG: aldolase [Rhizobiales bacterium 62-17]|nr:aldolase [Hyphomicrobiales bacterium]OJY05194.1 MAG: aldolase [Rhizobiales bacterium 62-17]